MSFSEPEVRKLSEARSDLGWVSVSTDMGIPPAIFQKILQCRQGELVEVERRARAGVTIRHWSGRQNEPVDDVEPNENGCECSCESCIGNDCLSCSDENCTDEACQNVRDRAEMSAHLDAVKNWISPAAMNLS